MVVAAPRCNCAIPLVLSKVMALTFVGRKVNNKVAVLEVGVTEIAHVLLSAAVLPTLSVPGATSVPPV